MLASVTTDKTPDDATHDDAGGDPARRPPRARGRAGASRREDGHEGGRGDRHGDRREPGTRGPVQLGALSRRTIEPALLRRAGLTMTLAANWPEIAGPGLAARTRPLRIRWGRRPHLGVPAAPGTLVVRAEAGVALRLQHEADALIERVNTLHGHAAIGRIAIEQGPVEQGPGERGSGERGAVERPAAPSPEAMRCAKQRTREIAHDGLREAMERLGARVIARAGTRTESSGDE